MFSSSTAASISNTTAAFNNYGTELERVGTNTGQVTSRSSSMLHTLATTVGQFYILYMAVKKVANVFAEWYTASNDYIENLNLFTVTMRDSTDAAYSYAESVEKIVGINISEWISYQGEFQQLTKGFGVSSEQADIMSQSLTQLSYDLSSFFNVDVETASDKLNSAMAGQVKGLREYGIDVSNASLQSYALSKGIDLTVSSMTQAQKSVLRYNYILEKTVDIQGDMTRTLVTPANALRVLSTQVDKLKRALGDIISTLVTQFIPYVQAAVTLITELANKIANFFGFELPTIDYSSLDDATSATEDLDDAASSVADDFSDAVDEVKELKKQLMGFDELNILKSSTTSSTSKTKSTDKKASNDYPSDLGLGVESYDFGLDSVTTSATEIVENLKKTFSTIFDPIVTAYNKYIKPIYEKAKRKITELQEVFNEWVNKLDFTPLGESINFVLSKLEPLADVIINQLGYVFENVFLPIGKIFVETILPAIVESIGYIIGAITPVIDGIGTVLKPIWENIIKPAFEKISEWFKKITEKVGPKLEELGSKIGETLKKWQPIIEKISEVIGPVITKIIDFLGGSLGGALEAGLESLIKIIDGIGGIADVITGLADGDNEKITSGFEKIGEAILEALIAPFKHIWAAISGGLEGIGVDVSGFFSGLWDNISGFFSGVGDWFSGIWENVSGFFSGVGDWFADIWGNISGFFNGVGDWFSDLWAKISNGWHTVIDPWIEIFKRAAAWVNEHVVEPVTGFFKGLWENVSGFFSNLWDDICGVWSTVSDWFNEHVIEPVTGFFGGIWEKVSDGASEAWEGIKSVFSHVADWFKNVFSEAWEKVQGVFSEGGKIFNNIKEGIASVFTTAVNNIINGLNTVIGGTFEGLNNSLTFIHNVEILGVKPFEWVNTVDVPQIPLIGSYASGGFPETGEYFLARESGPEMVGRIGSQNAVVNNDQIVTAISQAVYNAIISAGSVRSGESQKVGIEAEDVTLSGDIIFRSFVRAHNDYVYANGSSPLDI